MGFIQGGDSGLDIEVFMVVLIIQMVREIFQKKENI